MRWKVLTLKHRYKAHLANFEVARSPQNWNYLKNFIWKFWSIPCLNDFKYEVVGFRHLTQNGMRQVWDFPGYFEWITHLKVSRAHFVRIKQKCRLWSKIKHKLASFCEHHRWHTCERVKLFFCKWEHDYISATNGNWVLSFETNAFSFIRYFLPTSRQKRN